jgi:hypothetical protein
LVDRKGACERVSRFSRKARRPIEMKQTLSAFIHQRRRFWQSSPLADVRVTLGDPKSFMKLAKKHNAEDRAKMEKPRDDDKKPDDDSKGDDANA